MDQIWVFAFGIFALLLSSAVADDVVVLSEDNFEKEVGQDRGALVEFYAPWYCLFLFFIFHFLRSQLGFVADPIHKTRIFNRES